MRKRLVIAILISVSVLTPAGFAAWYASTPDIGFAAVTPYAHDFSGALPSENAPTIPVTHTTTAVTTAAVISETTAALPEPTQTTAGTTEQPTETTAFEVHYPLDLNAATFEELCTLPDIGAVTAQAILDERERLGGFTNRAQLRNVPGIGEKRFAGIAELVYIENEQPLPTDPPEEIAETVPVPEPEPSAPEPPAPAPEPEPEQEAMTVEPRPKQKTLMIEPEQPVSEIKKSEPVIVEFQYGKEAITLSEIIERAKKACGNKAGTLNIYIKPEENRVYFASGDSAGSFEI